MNEAIEENYQDDDFQQYVFEAAMMAVYGNDVWEWWNKVGA